MDSLSFVLGYNKGKAQGDKALDEVDIYLNAINGSGEISGTSADDRVKYVTFVDGETVLTDYPVIVGDTCKDVVKAGIIEAPTKNPTADTIYPLVGWSLTNGGEADENALTDVTEDRIVYAVFGEAVRTYTVNFYDGETLVNSEQVAYGSSTTYEATKEGYFLASWSPEPTNITSDMDCYAQWVESIAFADATWAEIDMASKNGYASKVWSVGDKKTITIGTLTREIVIVGFDMDKDSDGNTVGITMALADEPYPTETFAMDVYDDWANSASQVAVDGAFDDLPEDMQAVIKPVLKTYLKYTSMSEQEVKETTKSLWLFDAQELGDTSDSYSYTLPAYPYFNSNEARRFGSGGENTTGCLNYLTRTVYYNSIAMSGRDIYVTYNGEFRTGGSSYSVRFGFCV